MKTRFLALVLVLSAGACGGPPDGGVKCGDTYCLAGETCKTVEICSPESGVICHGPMTGKISVCKKK